MISKCLHSGQGEEVVMNVCSSPHPPSLFSGNPQRPYRGNMLQGDHGMCSQYAEHRPGPATLGRGGPFAIFRLALSHTGRFPGTGADPGRLRGRQLLLERQIPSVSSPPPPTGSSVAPQNEARLWGVGPAQRRKRRAPSFPTGGASSR